MDEISGLQTVYMKVTHRKHFTIYKSCRKSVTIMCNDFKNESVKFKTLIYNPSLRFLVGNSRKFMRRSYELEL